MLRLLLYWLWSDHLELVKGKLLLEVLNLAVTLPNLELHLLLHVPILVLLLSQ